MSQPCIVTFRVSRVPDSDVLVVQVLADGVVRRTDIFHAVERVTLEDHDVSYRGGTQWDNGVVVRLQWSDPGTKNRAYNFESRNDAVDFKTSVLKALGWTS